MKIATITSSGKAITYEDGVLLADGKPISVETLVEYDRLGTLTWASDDTRAWAHLWDESTTASTKPTPASNATKRKADDPAYRFGRWIGKHRVLAVVAALLSLVAIGYAIGGLSSGNDHRAVVTGGSAELGLAFIRDIHDGQSYSATPVDGLTVYNGDEVEYRDGTTETLKEITAVTKPAQAR